MRCGPNTTPGCGFHWSDAAHPHWVHECVSPVGHHSEHLCQENFARAQVFWVAAADSDDELGQLLASAVNGRPVYHVPLTRAPDLGERDPVTGQPIVNMVLPNLDLPEHRT